MPVVLRYSTRAQRAARTNKEYPGACAARRCSKEVLRCLYAGGERGFRLAGLRESAGSESRQGAGMRRSTNHSHTYAIVYACNPESSSTQRFTHRKYRWRAPPYTSTHPPWYTSIVYTHSSFTNLATEIDADPRDASSCQAAKVAP